MDELIEQAREAIDSMDDFARMANVVASGPLLVLSKAIDALEQQAIEVTEQARLNGMGSEREAAKDARIEELQRELDNERARGIHTCLDDCTRAGCVNRRLREQIEELSAALAVKNEALRKITKKANHLDVLVIAREANEALALQPHASLVAKIKAEARAEAIRKLASASFWEEKTRQFLLDLADRIEREVK